MNKEEEPIKEAIGYLEQLLSSWKSIEDQRPCGCIERLPRPAINKNETKWETGHWNRNFDQIGWQFSFNGRISQCETQRN